MRTSPAAVAAWLMAFSGLASSAGTTQWKDLGCYADGKPSTLSKFWDTQTFMTPTSCQRECETAGYKFTGLMGGNQCWCGDSVNTERAADASKCDVSCAGYPIDICGGVNYFNIYEDSANTASANPSISSPSTSTVPTSTVLTSTASTSTASTSTTPNPAAPTPATPNPATPNPATPNPATPTPAAPNPTTSNPNSANGVSSGKLETLFILLLGWTVHQYR